MSIPYLCVLWASPRKRNRRWQLLLVVYIVICVGGLAVALSMVLPQKPHDNAAAAEENMYLVGKRFIGVGCLRPAIAAHAWFCRWSSTLLFVYTSGTTGLPKASKITHLRFFSAAALFAVTARLRPDDRSIKKYAHNEQTPFDFVGHR